MAVSPILYAPSSRASQPITLLTTELNSLANNAATAPSSAIDNDTVNVLDLYMDVELLVTFGTGPTVNTTLDLYLIRSVDATNYEDASATGPILPQNGYAGSFVLRSVTTAQRIILPGILCPPLDFKVMVLNNATGQAMAASGNTLKGYFYHLSVG
jgi:hypothetical protein